jgi:6-phosphogluconolactonase
MIRCYSSAEELVKQLCARFYEMIIENVSSQDTVSIAISGGNTPALFYEELARAKSLTGKNFPWNKIHFFWVDERCVPQDHPESNFRMFDKAFIQKFQPGEINFHRIRGEADPNEEANRYAGEIELNVNMENSIPVFDWVFLGIGEDGHTASIFPDNMDLLHTEKICDVVKHPKTGQLRITLTGGPLLKAYRTTFIVTGSAKQEVISHITLHSPLSEKYPANYVYLHGRLTELYLDEQAARQLNISCRGKH